MNNSGLMTMGDVCAFLRVSESTLRRMCKKGIFPKGKAIFERKLYWTRAAVEGFANSTFNQDALHP